MSGDGPSRGARPLGGKGRAASSARNPNADGDLGFRHVVRANGEVEIRRGGLVAATLRGEAGRRFLARIDGADDAQRQQAMARATGNYKRGNERVAKGDP